MENELFCFQNVLTGLWCQLRIQFDLCRELSSVNEVTGACSLNTQLRLVLTVGVNGIALHISLPGVHKDIFTFTLCINYEYIYT